jgi:trk system potassium uptake protein
MLPVSAESGVATRPVTALFTTVSLVCVTGLIIVDTPTCWSTIGELVILLMIQLGGLGIMTVATLLLLLVARRIGLHLHLTAAAETRAVGLSRWSLHVRVTVITYAILLVIGVAAFLLGEWTTRAPSARSIPVARS